MAKTPDGFRAVRYCDSIHIYYVIEQAEDGCFRAESDDNKPGFLVEPGAFKKLFCREHSQDMPPAVCARFEGKPTFAEWWAERSRKTP